jgi:Na+:H+ antiporter, NhaA family
MAVRLKEIRPTIFQRFFRTETVGGSVLLLFGVAALVLANSPLGKVYDQLWQTEITVGIVNHTLSFTLRQWMTNGGVLSAGRA